MLVNALCKITRDANVQSTVPLVCQNIDIPLFHFTQSRRPLHHSRESGNQDLLQQHFWTPDQVRGDEF